MSASNPLVTVSNTHVEWVADFDTPVWVNAISIQLANTVYGAVMDIEVCGVLDRTRKDLLDSDSGLDFASDSAVTVYLANWEACSAYEVALRPHNNQMYPITIQSLVFLSTHAQSVTSLVYAPLTINTYQFVDCHRPAVRAFHSYSMVVQTPQGNLTAFTINPVTGCVSGRYTSEVSATCVVSAYTSSNRLVTARFRLTVSDLPAASVLLSLYAHDLGDVGKFEVIRGRSGHLPERCGVGVRGLCGECCDDDANEPPRRVQLHATHFGYGVVVRRQRVHERHVDGGVSQTCCSLVRRSTRLE